jgi:MFS family permease
VWALLPLVARHTMGGGPLVYGLLLGALGVGAVLGAFAIGRLRRLLGTEAMIDGASVCFAATTLALAVVPNPPVVFAMLALGGGAWLAALATFNTSVQISVSGWVKARALSIYLMAVFGGMAGGSWLWGALAEQIGLSQSLGVAAAAMCGSVLLSFVVPLSDTSMADVQPATPLAEPHVAIELDDEAGPVLVRVEYRVAADKVHDFAEAMRAVRRVRRRDGATRWGLYQDVEDAERWVEVFLVDTWVEHLRQHARGTRADRALVEHAFSFHRGPGAPPVSHLIRRQPGAMILPASPSDMPPF